MGHATDPTLVAEQAAVVAAAWSPPGAPASWSLTAAQLATLRDDPELLEIAAAIAPDRLPPLLFSAAATWLVLALEPEPLRAWFPRIGEPQSPLGAGFGAAYRGFCLDHRDRLMELCDRHRYQMNEVGRCAHVLPAIAPGRPLALVDVGTGAGLALHLDRYRYAFVGPDGRGGEVGQPGSDVLLATEVRGPGRVPVPPALPHVAHRVGLDAEPLDLRDADVRGWLAACVPQEIGAVTRFHHAVAVAAAHPVRSVQGDALAALPAVVAAVPEDLLLCLVDSYVNVFFAAGELRRFRAFVDAVGAQRDLDWISLDPLVPMGASATDCVTGVPVPASVVRRNRAGAVFGVLSRVSYREGRRTTALLGIGHPGAAWLEWLGADGDGAGR